jgi:hypothetical protein
MGFEHEDIQTQMEDHNGKPKKKIVKTMKYYPPDLNAAKYLLIIKFGRSFNEKKDELDLMERRIDEKENEWTNEQNFYKEVNHEV